MKIKKFLSIFLILVLGCARGPTVSKDALKVPDSRLSGADARELERGRQIHQAIVSSFRVYTEPRLVGYVTRIGRSIARVSERKNLDYRFTVLYDNRAYATEAPGGFVYVTTGFLNFLQNEAELASVLAYEVAILQFRDPRFSVAKQAFSRFAQASAVVGPFFGQIGILATTAVVLLNALTESNAPSEEERVGKADQRVLHYLLESSHDPQGYLDLLNRQLNLNPEWTPYFYDYLSTRPVTIQRYQKVLEEFQKLALEGKSFNVNHARYLEMTKGVRDIYQR